MTFQTTAATSSRDRKQLETRDTENQYISQSNKIHDFITAIADNIQITFQYRRRAAATDLYFNHTINDKQVHFARKDQSKVEPTVTSIIYLILSAALKNKQI